MTLFLSFSLKKHSQSNSQYRTARLNGVSIDCFLTYLNKLLGIHSIRPKLYPIPFVSMHKLDDRCLNSPNSDKSSREKINRIVSFRTFQKEGC